LGLIFQPVSRPVFVSAIFLLNRIGKYPNPTDAESKQMFLVEADHVPLERSQLSFVILEEKLQRLLKIRHSLFLSCFVACYLNIEASRHKYIVFGKYNVVQFEFHGTYGCTHLSLFEAHLPSIPFGIERRNRWITDRA